MSFFSSNKRSSIKGNKRTSALPAQLVAANGGMDSLSSHDLDEIYKFVNHMKQSNVGESLLGDFVVRQAEEAELDDVAVPHRRRESSATKPSSSFPITTIQVPSTPQKSPSKKHSSKRKYLRKHF